MNVAVTDPMSAGVVLFQGAILGILLVAIRRLNGAAIVNALVAFAATFLPPIVESTLRFAVGESIAFGPELALWIAVAGCLHSFGMLGPYDSIWWWDHLTHTVSAALVAALIYAGFIAVRNANVLELSIETIGALTIVATFVVGIFWELIELLARDIGERHRIEPVLVHYGWRDTIFDLVFNVVGALLVVLFNLQLFVSAAS